MFFFYISTVGYCSAILRQADTRSCTVKLSDFFYSVHAAFLCHIFNSNPTNSGGTLIKLCQNKANEFANIPMSTLFRFLLCHMLIF